MDDGEVRDESRRGIRTMDFVNDRLRNRPTTAALPEPTEPESSCSYWIEFGLRALKDAFIFGCVVVGAIFLAVAIYNALCDPFEYFFIFLIGVVSYIVFLAIALLLSYFLGDFVGLGRFYGTVSQSAIKSGADTQSHKNIRISRRGSNTTAAETFVEESQTVERIAQELQSGRNLSGTGESYTYGEPEGRDNNSAPPMEQLYLTPTVPLVNEFHSRSEENCDADNRENNEQNAQPPDCDDDNDWFNRQQYGGPLIPSDFPACQAERMRMNALRCSATVTAPSAAVAGNCRQSSTPTPTQPTSAIPSTRCETLSNNYSPDMNVQQPRTCLQPETFQQPRNCPQPETFQQPRTCPQPITTCRHRDTGRLRRQTRHLSPHSSASASGTRRNSNTPQERGRSDNSNLEGNPRVFPQPGTCGLNPIRPPEYAFFRTDE